MKKIDSLATELHGIYMKSHASIKRSINGIGKGIEKIHDGLHKSSQLRPLISQIMQMQKRPKLTRHTSKHYQKPSSYNTSTAENVLAYMSPPMN